MSRGEEGEEEDEEAQEAEKDEEAQEAQEAEEGERDERPAGNSFKNTPGGRDTKQGTNHSYFKSLTLHLSPAWKQKMSRGIFLFLDNFCKNKLGFIFPFSLPPLSPPL